MRRVLIVSYVFPPMVAGGAPRLGQFAAYLPDHGWAPTILTGPAESVDERMCSRLPESVSVVRADCPVGVGIRGTPTPRAGVGRVLREAVRSLSQLLLIPDRHIFWLPAAVRAGLAALRRERHEVIFASFGPATTLLVGWRLAVLSGLPLVVDFRDLWSDRVSPYPFRTGLHRRIAATMERRVVSRASKVIAVADRMTEWLRRKHRMARRDVACITNGFDPEDLGRARDGRDGGGRPFRLCFTGSVYGPHNMEPFFSVVAELLASGVISPRTFRMEFVGNLPQEEVDRHGIGAIAETHPYVPHHRVFEVYARADALMMIEGVGYWGEFSYSAKIFDYLLTGKPVLALIEPGGNGARLLAEAGVGHVAHPEDRAAIRERLLALIDCAPMPPRMIDLSREPFCRLNRRHLTARLAKVLADAAG